MRDTSKLVVVDLESTCWYNVPPVNQESEIIEIGVCTLDLQSLEVGEPLSLLVKPASEISTFCTELTGWTQADIDFKGTTLDEAFKVLRKQYNSKNRIWASYGQYDQNQVRKECERKQFNYPFGTFHLNIKAVVETVLGQPFGMAEALKKLNMELEGRHHNGRDDSLNIAKVYARLLKHMRQGEGLC